MCLTEGQKSVFYPSGDAIPHRMATRCFALPMQTEHTLGMEFIITGRNVTF